jgi:hypothetical protein
MVCALRGTGANGRRMPPRNRADKEYAELDRVVETLKITVQ